MTIHFAGGQPTHLEAFLLYEVVQDESLHLSPGPETSAGERNFLYLLMVSDFKLMVGDGVI